MRRRGGDRAWLPAAVAAALLLGLGAQAGVAGAAPQPAAASQSPAAARPPVIHEPFIALPCPSEPMTTVDLIGCGERRILRTDRLIDRRARAIFALLPAAGRPPLVRGERSWLHYRRALCTAETARYEGGTFQPVAFGNCEVRVNRVHIRDLGAAIRSLSHP